MAAVYKTKLTARNLFGFWGINKRQESQELELLKYVYSSYLVVFLNCQFRSNWVYQLRHSDLYRFVGRMQHLILVYKNVIYNT